jgi:hypothetical protein
MPRIKAPDDWQAMTTRPRLIMEDPRQLVSGGVTDYVTAQLWRQNNQPEKCDGSSLDGFVYSRLS